MGSNRALELEASCSLKVRGRACRNIARLILVAEPVAPSYRVAGLLVGSLDRPREKRAQESLNSRRNRRMSIAGLRFGADGRAGTSNAPREAKSGPISTLETAGFHDWEFRTRLRIRCMQEALKTKSSWHGTSVRGDWTCW